jgi:hypothetical protein
MSDIETRVRRALNAIEPSAPNIDDAWATLRPRLSTTVTAPTEHTVAENRMVAWHTPRRRWLLAAAVVIGVLAATIAVLATRSRSALGPFSGGPHDGGIPHFVLDDPRLGLLVDAAYEESPIGTNVYGIVLRSEGEPATVISIDATPDTASYGGGTAVESVQVNGQPGQLVVAQLVLRLRWSSDGVGLHLVMSGPKAARDVALRVASRIVAKDARSNDKPPSVVLGSPPDGYREVYAGVVRDLSPAPRTTMAFTRSGQAELPPFLWVTVSPISAPTKTVATTYGMQRTTIKSRVAYVGPVGLGVTTNPTDDARMLLIDIDAHYRLEVIGDSSVTIETLQSVVSGLRRVSESTWVAAMNYRLQRNESSSPNATSSTTFATAPPSTA